MGLWSISDRCSGPARHYFPINSKILPIVSEIGCRNPSFQDKFKQNLVFASKNIFYFEYLFQYFYLHNSMKNLDKVCDF
ncbi:MAG TPA: hypothetical protein DCS82_04120 [Rhodospirillaceae bacterium]|nr:hypothetical protein [Rhodospirillaceae bacterium]